VELLRATGTATRRSPCQCQGLELLREELEEEEEPDYAPAAPAPARKVTRKKRKEYDVQRQRRKTLKRDRAEGRAPALCVVLAALITFSLALRATLAAAISIDEAGKHQRNVKASLAHAHRTRPRVPRDFSALAGGLGISSPAAKAQSNRAAVPNDDAAAVHCSRDEQHSHRRARCRRQGQRAASKHTHTKSRRETTHSARRAPKPLKHAKPQSKAKQNKTRM
jgi:hypothetical protein